MSVRLKIDKWTSIETDTRCMKIKTHADRQINKNKHTLYLYANWNIDRWIETGKYNVWRTDTENKCNSKNEIVEGKPSANVVCPIRSCECIILPVCLHPINVKCVYEDEKWTLNCRQTILSHLQFFKPLPQMIFLFKCVFCLHLFKMYLNVM